MASAPKNHRAVMASRVEPPDSLDLFCTPPWATRALLECAIPISTAALQLRTCWDPCAGKGHMTEVLWEYFGAVHSSDVFDYGCDYHIGSFVGVGPDVAHCPAAPSWIIMNPPFNLAEEFVERALDEAVEGVAVLIRTTWLETHGRYDNLFSKRPPTTVALFAERVPMVKGRWDPQASTATAYCWIIWNLARASRKGTRLIWIPTGTRAKLTRVDDVKRFTSAAHEAPKP